MSELHLNLPSYQTFVDSIAVLALPLSGSELHGLMCGYLCAGASNEGEAYLRTLMASHKDESTRAAALALFDVYAISQQQIIHLDFAFQMLLPEDHNNLHERAQAFSEWCNGFTQGLQINGINGHDFHEEEAQEAIVHLAEFAELDPDSIDMGEDDEKAFIEVSEYARMAVLRLHGDLRSNSQSAQEPNQTH